MSHVRTQGYFHSFINRCTEKIPMFVLRRKSATILPLSVTNCEQKINSTGKRQMPVAPFAANGYELEIHRTEKRQVTVNPPAFFVRGQDIHKTKKRQVTEVPAAAIDCRQEIRCTKEGQVTVVLPAANDCRQEIRNTEERDISASFRLIITVAVLIGLPISPSMVYSDSKKVAAFLRIWSTVVFGVRIVFIVFECVYNHLLWPSYAMRYSFLVHCLVGFTLMLIFYVKRHDVSISLLKLEQLSLDSRDKAKDKTSLMDVLMSLCFVCFTSLLTLGAYFFFCLTWDFCTQQIAILSPVAADSVFVYSYNCIVLSAVLLSYNLSSATLYVTTLLCCHACLVSGKLLQHLQERMKYDSEKGSLKAAAASRNLRLFMRIFFCVERVDSALNKCALGVFAAVINGFYIVLSMFLSGEESYRSTGVVSIAGLIGLVSSIKFLSLTLFGDFLLQKHRELKRNLI